MPKLMKLRRIPLATARRIVDCEEAQYVNKKDFVDKGIEPKIRPVVIALVAHGFPTQNSCEGHIRTNLYPWIRFQPILASNTKGALLLHLKKIRWEVEQLQKLLVEFWESNPRLTQDRELKATAEWDLGVASDKQIAEEYLKIRAKGFFAPPGYWLRCSGAETLQTLPAEILGPYRRTILKNRQGDMRKFARFLRSKL